MIIAQFLLLAFVDNFFFFYLILRSNKKFKFFFVRILDLKKIVRMRIRMALCAEIDFLFANQILLRNYVIALQRYKCVKIIILCDLLDSNEF